MKQITLASAAVCAISLLGASAQEAQAAKRRAPGPARPAFSSAQLVQGNNAFALDFYKTLGKGNLICSPYGVSEVFAMAQAGARGGTAKEIAAAFHFPEAQATLHRSYAMLRTQVAAASRGDGLALKIADSVWPEKSRMPLPAYVRTLKKYYSASVTPLDYAKSEEARSTINSWAENNTESRIKDLLPPDAVNAATKLVLVNAVYFKGLWENQFKADATMDLPFHAPDGDKTAPLMYQKNTFSFAEDENAHVLELPYKGGAVSMLVALPQPEKTLEQVEASLCSNRLDAWKEMLQKKEVQVWLPKFKAEAFYDLKGALESLGVKSAFDPAKADFSAIDGKGELYVTKALQKAFVEVNEEGTEAAAATAVVFGKLAMAAPPKAAEFRADRPFLYLLRHNATGAILFIGRVEDPTK